ncbi:response regulator with CheY-like receiver domain and winged-helix DNA-binding domain [Nostoc sp. PCC 7524]|nr:response regulator with CheY-like receiver domain and winged-helix DNA-binding domain [Nostoc sp. PCC 7524]
MFFVESHTHRKMMHETLQKILVIEDDAVTRNLYLNGLKFEGFDTISAENGLVGIQKAQEHLPDIVVCDIIMPHIDGYTVLNTLRQNPYTAGIPFIFLTGSDTRANLRQGMELGADDYITKPSTLDELLRAIASRLRKQTSLQNWCQNKLQKLPPAEPSPNTSVDSQSIFPSIPQLQEVFEFIEAYFHQGITLCDVAAAVGYSPAYLTNRVAKQTGETINNWIVKRRMVEARRLLQNTEETVEQIAKLLGYQHVCHFSRQFRQHHGLPPHAWRLDYKNKEGVAEFQVTENLDRRERVY